jgi:hypothetical protein
MYKAKGTTIARPEILTVAEEQVAYGRATAQEKARSEELIALLAEMRAENGPPNDEEEAWARRVLGL